MYICDVTQEIMINVAPMRRKNTQVLYHLYLNEISSEIGNMDINEFSLSEYMLWIKGFKMRKSKRHTFNDYTKYINIIFRYAYLHKYATHLLTFPVTDGEREPAWRVYSKEELTRIWKEANNVNFDLQFVLTFECFMRLREILSLSWDRVDFGNNTIILRKQDVKTGSKTKRGRVIPMSTLALELLKKRFETAESKFVFPSGDTFVGSNQTVWENVKKRSRIFGRARFHDLRHTALSMAVLEHKVPLIHVSKVAGTSVRTLERVYLHADVSQLREVTQSLQIEKINLISC